MRRASEELLEEYLNALSDNPNVLVPDGLPSDLAEFARQLALTQSQEIQDRVWRKTLLLAQTAREFSVNLQARAPVLRNDEMGTLAHTFNRMADAIGDVANRDVFDSRGGNLATALRRALV